MGRGREVCVKEWWVDGGEGEGGGYARRGRTGEGKGKEEATEALSVKKMQAEQPNMSVSLNTLPHQKAIGLPRF